ncbi:MAG: hypothetical protein GXX05_02475, partial [Firmicutes bacterium]|nr:hypothetical protein [Bacillota bacterium]
FTTDGRTASITTRDGKLYSILVADGTTLSDEAGMLVSLSRQGTFALTVEGGVV